MAAFPELLWLVVCGSLAAFAFGWATGSNDVANAFGTSVGSKVLTLWQATLIAAVFEFAGALVLGRVTTSVIAGGIANISTFQDVPEIYAYGMVCNLFVGFMFQGFASYMGFNVSATHCIIGGILGFSMAYGGAGAVNWAKPDTSGTAFPFQGAAPVVLSWFISPILTGMASALIFITLRFLVLNRPNAHKLSYFVLPPAVLLTVWVCMYFVFTKGAKTMLSNDDWDMGKSAWVAAIIAGAAATLTAVVVLPLLARRSRARFGTNDEYEANKAKGMKTDAAGNAVNEAEEGDVVLPVTDGPKDADVRSPTWPENKVGYVAHTVKKALLHGVSVDIHAVVEEDPIVAAIHRHAQVFDPRVEYNFGALQVFSAICVIFAHGANDVGYMTGPLATIYQVYDKGYLSSKVTPAVWVIVLSASGLVIGLATYGYNVTRAMGTMMAKLSPTRGFSAELATAMVIMVCSQYGLPTSSSQCIVGAIVGVGLAEGIMGVNWKFFAKQAASWLGTLFAVGLVTAAIFAQGIYTPSAPQSRALNSYKQDLTLWAGASYGQYNATLQSFQPASEAGLLKTLPFSEWQELNATVQANYLKLQPITNATATVSRNVAPDTVLTNLKNVQALLQKDSIFTLGQETLEPGAVQCNSANVAQIKAGTQVACPMPPLTPPDFVAAN